MDRRVVLAGTGTLLSAPLSGCLAGSSRFRGTDDSDERDPNDGDGDDVESDADSEGNDSETRTTTDSGHTYDPTRQDPIFVENHGTDEVIVELVVERISDATILVEHTYEVPGRTGLEIPDVGAVGSEYVVRAEHEGAVDEYEWTVLTCAHDHGAGGRTALGVEVLEGDVEIRHTDCDESGAGDDRDLTYEPHHEHVLDE